MPVEDRDSSAAPRTWLTDPWGDGKDGTRAGRSAVLVEFVSMSTHQMVPARPMAHRSSPRFGSIIDEIGLAHTPEACGTIADCFQ